MTREELTKAIKESEDGFIYVAAFDPERDPDSVFDYYVDLDMLTEDGAGEYPYSQLYFDDSEAWQAQASYEHDRQCYGMTREDYEFDLLLARRAEGC